MKARCIPILLCPPISYVVIFSFFPFILFYFLFVSSYKHVLLTLTAQAAVERAAHATLIKTKFHSNFQSAKKIASLHARQIDYKSTQIPDLAAPRWVMMIMIAARMHSFIPSFILQILLHSSFISISPFYLSALISLGLRCQVSVVSSRSKTVKDSRLKVKVKVRTGTGPYAS